jgi:tetratricopeptide (TPR) repeat protein
LINRGIAYQKKGDFDRAIAGQTRVIKETKAAGAYYNRGNALVAKGDYARAITDYTKAIELQPNSAVHTKREGKPTPNSTTPLWRRPIMTLSSRSAASRAPRHNDRYARRRISLRRTRR